VETLSSISPDDAAALARLLGQLSTTATFDTGRLHAIIDHEATELLVARVGGQIVGMATFVSFPLPTGLRGHVEDVVVDESMRGRGIARKLLKTMTTMACEPSTSPRDHRANRLFGSTRESGSDDEKQTSFDTPPSEPRSPPQSVQGPARYDRAFAVWNPLNGTLRAMQWTR
jgi:GNAT superfamily N-acetyltransferase